MEIEIILPYAVSIITAMISAFVSIMVCKKQTENEIEKVKAQNKADIEKLEKQYNLDIQKEREKFQLEKEKMELEHKYELEKMNTKSDNDFSSVLTSKLFGMVMDNKEIQDKINEAVSNGLKQQ